jgi:glutaredoxin-like protein NrdH
MKEELMVTVYSTPECTKCAATKTTMDSKGIEYIAVDLSEDEEATAYVKSLGYLNAPVVVAGDEHWSGFRPDKIAKLVPATV